MVKDLAYLIAHSDIADALAHFCSRMDSADYPGALEVFTDDCVTDYGPSGGGAIRGRDAFLRRIRKSQANFTHTHHQLGQIQSSIEGNSASSVSYLASLHVTAAGDRIDAYIQYHDVWIKEAAGWRISARRCQFDVVDGDSQDRAWTVRVAGQTGEASTGGSGSDAGRNS
jgi:hypothetical protein